MSRLTAALGCVLAFSCAVPLAAQSCLGAPPAPGGVGGAVTPTFGAGGGGTEVGIVAGYAHAAGVGARGRFASTRFGGGDASRRTLGAELAYDVSGLILAPDAPPIHLCPVLGFGSMSIGSLSESSFLLGAAAGGSVQLAESGEWTLHPYGSLGYLRATRTFETLRRTEGGAALRAGVLAGRGRFIGGVEAEHSFVFASDPTFRIRFGLRL